MKTVSPRIQFEKNKANNPVSQPEFARLSFFHLDFMVLKIDEVSKSVPRVFGIGRSHGRQIVQSFECSCPYKSHLFGQRLNNHVGQGHISSDSISDSTV